MRSGTKLVSYEILGSLGAGGMGEVYRALDTKLGREVAVKVLPEALGDRERRARELFSFPRARQESGVASHFGRT